MPELPLQYGMVKPMILTMIKKKIIKAADVEKGKNGNKAKISNNRRDEIIIAVDKWKK